MRVGEKGKLILEFTEVDPEVVSKLHEKVRHLNNIEYSKKPGRHSPNIKIVDSTLDADGKYTIKISVPYAMGFNIHGVWSGNQTPLEVVTSFFGVLEIFAKK